MTALTDLTLAEARDGLARGDFTSVELTDAHIAAVEAARPLNVFITETPERARAMARASDQRRAAAEGQVGAMEGLPIGMKDLFCTKDVLTTAASHILDGFHPPYESTVSGKLWDAGAVMLGKLNMDEFAMGSSNETSHYGPAINPWAPEGDNRKYVPGGSSGGSASAVAARCVLAATGTDTGGSIRQPAGFSGIVGVKPTYGRCSRFGIVAFASSLDQAGPMTRSVRDAAIMLGAMAGFDPQDSTSVDMPIPDFEAAMTGDIRGLKIGVPAEYRMDGMPEEIEALWRRGEEMLADAGAEITPISLPHTRHALPAYYIVAPAEASSNLARYDGMRFGLRRPGADLIDTYERTRAEGFGDEVQRRIMIGAYVLSAGYYDAYYLKAQKVRTLILRDFEEAFTGVDAILTPTTPFAAFAQGERSGDPVAMYLNDIFTVPASMAGLPGASVPVGLSKEGMPLGLQILAPAFDEETMFRVAGVLESAAGLSAAPRQWWRQ